MTQAIHLGQTGVAAWKFLNRSEAGHIERLAKDPVVNRNINHFRENVAATNTAGDLVNDYKMLRVALGAHGLEADIRNRAFIRKVLESDLDDKKSLANRLSDKRYLRFAEAFGFHARKNGAPAPADMGETVSRQYVEREFERRVGLADDSLRLAMNLRRELGALASRESSDSAKWFEVIGNRPLRKVFDAAFGFGPQFARADIDRQHQAYVRASKRQFGTSAFSELSEPKLMDKLVRTYLVRSRLDNGASSNKYSLALTLMAHR